MPPPLGNQFWKLRASFDSNRIFTDAAILWQCAAEYFAWCDAHPWERNELVKHKGDAYEMGVGIHRMYTRAALCAYLGVSGSYLRSARANIKMRVDKKCATAIDLELLGVLERIDLIIESQQIEGAAVGAFSTQLITRMQNLTDANGSAGSGESTINIVVRDQQTADDLEQLEDLL